MTDQRRTFAPTFHDAERQVIRSATSIATVRTIINTVARQCGLLAADITSSSMRTDIVQARDQVCYLARSQGMSLPLIGRAVNRHHTSVMDAVRREQARREEVS